ncbi:hypothetical protein PSTT_02493 [Puccinia striiformis]|uniref:Uncharacterized protein n=1 Tax=Puccinia striiformis TaxID=27350 RepID=A0A2S4VZJ2_9BASI|nr:hypothetical protein PSTT_02493 [Puccinia striiformis]
MKLSLNSKQKEEHHLENQSALTLSRTSIMSRGIRILLKYSLRLK